MKYLLCLVIFLTGCVSGPFVPNFRLMEIPILVSEMIPEHQEAMVYAADQWNERLGHKKFSIVYEGSALIYASSEDIDDKYGGIYYEPTFLRPARIVLRKSFSGCDVEVVALHELGHALGLQHSDDVSDVMYYSTAGGYKDLSENDVRLAKINLGLY